jgi:class 3 adenylate cyclase
MTLSSLRGYRLALVAAVLLPAHLAVFAFEYPEGLAEVARDVLGLLGAPAVLLGAWVTARGIDRLIGRIPWSMYGFPVAMLRLTLGVGLMALVPVLVPVAGILEPGTLARGVADVGLALEVVVGLLLGSLGLADLIYATTTPFKHLSLRLMMLLCVASTATIVIAGGVGNQVFEQLIAVLGRGHLAAHAGAIVAAFETAKRQGGMVGALVLSLPPTLLLAWRFSQDATQGLEELRAGFARVARGDLASMLEVRGNDEVGDMQRAFNSMLLASRERHVLESAFSRYVSPVLLDRLRARAETTIRLPAERREATVLFSDIRGFTAMSASLPPEEVIGVLNAYMSLMIETIARYDGYINKFVGDAIMVIWNAPVDHPLHAYRAVVCAQAMMQELVKANDEGAFGPRKLTMGIGINTGPVIAGNLGNRRQVEFTVIGDTVNVASRACSHARPGQVIITRAVASHLEREGLSGRLPTDSLGPVTLKGKGDVELLVMRDVEPSSAGISPHEAEADRIDRLTPRDGVRVRN